MLHYRFVDGAGNPLGGEQKASAALSECEPVVRDGKVVFYASQPGVLSFYSIDATSNGGAFTKKTICVAGEHASWSFKGDTLTVSGTGAISSYLVGASLDSWENDIEGGALEDVSERIKTIVIKNGITSIGAEAFYNLSIDSYTDVHIPKSVTSIGKNAFATGWTWVGTDSPVIPVRIICEKGSAAQSYAEENDINYDFVHLGLPNRVVAYTGKPIALKPERVGTLGKLTCTYYIDKACKTMTGASQGARASGAAPSKVGTYYARATTEADGTFPGQKSRLAKLVIKKAAQKVKLSKSTLSVSAKTLSKKSMTVRLSATATAKTPVTFKKLSGDKRIVVNKKGKITLKKGLAKGTYKVKVQLLSAGGAGYEKLVVAKVITVKVK